MTLLVAWAAVDTHGTSSVYFASDSCISWGDQVTFNRGRKVFACRRHPDILGYCGDVLFPALALGQIVDLADAGLLFSPSMTSATKFETVVKKLNDLASEYPRMHAGFEANPPTIIHASREDIGGNKTAFSCRTISWTAKRGWVGKSAPMPRESAVLFALGSGSKAFVKNIERYWQGPTARTSRAVFHCFCDTLTDPTAQAIGGPPQLVGIIRKPSSTAVTYGVLYAGQRTFLGAHIDNLGNFHAVEWRNEYFERCDGATGKRIAGAQLQPDPLRRRQ